MNCPSCGTANDPGHRFCNACGAALAATPTCRTCGTALPAGSRFCTACGTSVAPAPEAPQGPGYVVDGEWHRAPGEIARRVPSDALRSAFTRLVPGLDWKAYLEGTLAGKILDLLGARSIRVPMGSVGVVVRDGVVVRILPPGEQTTPGFFKDLLAGAAPGVAAAAAAERWLAGDLALYLVDRRPVPVSFATELPTGTGTRTLAATALVSIGGHRDALGAFLSDVVADRDSLAAEDLYVRFRSEIERAVAEALRARPSDLPAAEKQARDELRARFGARTGLSFDLTLAPRHAVHRMDVLLASGPATQADAACASCGATVRAGARFCTSCGTAVAAPVDPAEVLACSDGAAVEVDLVLSVQADAAPAPPIGILRAAAARWLRARPWSEVAGAVGLDGLEAALRDAATDALGALGFRLLALDVVDVRSRGEAWALGARAAIAQAQIELQAGREWLAVRDDEAALAALGAASALKAERMRRDAAFDARKLALEDARRAAELEAGERAVERARAEGEHADVVAADARERAREGAAREHVRTERRADDAAESERARLAVDDRAYAERKRREERLAELAAMADLDARIAEREHRQSLETMDKLSGHSEAQMLAMQAGSLASQEHGAAFADALGKLADGEAARRERDKADAAARASAQAIADLAKAAIEANAKVAAARAAAPGACPKCGQALPPGARFCGGCGATLA